MEVQKHVEETVLKQPSLPCALVVLVACAVVSAALEAVGFTSVALPWLPSWVSRLVAVAVTYAFILAPVLLACVVGHLGARSVGLVSSRALVSNVAGVLVGAGIVMVGVLVMPELGLGRGLLAAPEVMLVLAVAAFCEELLFRGWLQGAILRTFGTRFAHPGQRGVASAPGFAASVCAIILTAALFALFHIPKLLLAGAPANVALMSAFLPFVGGILFGVAARMTGDVYAATWIHLACNVAALSL